MLQADVSDLKARADRFAGKVGPGARAIQLNSVVGGGSAPERYIPSWGVALDGARPDTELEQLLRSSDPPVIVRIEDGKVVLDFRTIFRRRRRPAPDCGEGAVRAAYCPRTRSRYFPSVVSTRMTSPS